MIGNRKSKAMDYKELWEEAGTDEVVAVLNNPNLDPDVKKTLMSAYRQKHITADGVLAIVDLVLKKGSINEGYEHLRYLVSDLKNLYHSSNDAAFKKAIVDAIPDGNKYQYILDTPKEYIQKLEALKQMLPQAKLSDVKGAMNIIDDAIEFFQNKETLQEGYAKFRNETKMRSKPDQFHQAVKQVKQKMNEINRIFEYVDRLKSELSEGEDLKYKKYTENAFQQIKESAKALFLKSTKLK